MTSTSLKRSLSNEYVSLGLEEPQSTTAIEIKTDSSKSFGFNIFDSKRIDRLLLRSSSLIKAFHLVEALIQNPNLNVYFAHVAIPELRSVNIFDKENCLKYSAQIKIFLCELVRDLQFSVANLPDAYSHFIGNHAKISTSIDDVIQYDSTTIHGIIHSENSKRATPATLAKQIFFLLVKTLHELGHASIYRSGRLMVSKQRTANKSECFSTPATHALAAEAGNAVERFLFGSVIGAIGKMDGDLYLIKEVLLQEQRPSGIIDSYWLMNFINSDLLNLDSIPVTYYVPLTNKKLKATKTSPRCEENHHNDDDDNSDDDEDDDKSEDDYALLTTIESIEKC